MINRLERASAASVSRANPVRLFDNQQQLDLNSSLVVKLPTFDGDLVSWMEFWELYNVSVNQNLRYANVQRLVLLKYNLGSASRQTIEKIPDTEEGYRVVNVIGVLTKRYA